MAAFLHVENLFWVAFVATAVAFIYAGVQFYRTRKLPVDEPLREFSQLVGKGVLTFLKRQCMVSVPLFTAVLLSLFGLEWLGVLSNPNLPLAFLSGGVCAALAGLFALFVSVLSNVRVTTAVTEGTHNGFNVAFTAGTAAAFGCVGLALCEVFVWFHILRYGLEYTPQHLASTLLLFGAGAAYAALLSRLVSGIYAKAADLNSDMPSAGEDVPEGRGLSGVIADCVGDNVTNAAGAVSDLYAGYVLALLAALCTAAWAFADHVILWNALLFPVAVAVIGVASSLLSCLLIKAEENSDERALLAMLRKGAWIAAGLTGVLSAPISYLLTGSWGPFLAVVIGLVAAQGLANLSSRSASNLYPNVRRLASTAESGVFSALTGAAGLGLHTASYSLLVLILAVAAAFLATGGQLDAAYETLYQNALAHGFYGIALAGVGFLSTSAYSLSAALLSPIADNADCAARMSGLDRALQGRAGVLNFLGGSLASLGRNLSAGASLLLAPVLVWLYTVSAKSSSGALGFTVTSPILLLGGFAGIILTALFTSILFSGVQSCALPVAAELRRQSRGGVRLNESVEAGCTACIDLCARGAATRALMAALFATAAPFVAAVALGPEGTVGLLLAVSLLGLAGALFLSCMGSALGCARRRVEGERRGSSEARRSALIADMVGGLFKDVTGPSLGALVRVCFTFALLLAMLSATHNLLSLPG